MERAQKGKGLVSPVPTWNLCITAGARGGLGHQTQDAAYLHHSCCLGSGHGDCWSSRSHYRRAVQRRGPQEAAGPGAADPWCHTQGQHQGILDKAGAWANWQEKNKPIRGAQLGGSFTGSTGNCGASFACQAGTVLRAHFLSVV